MDSRVKRNSSKYYQQKRGKAIIKKKRKNNKKKFNLLKLLIKIIIILFNILFSILYTIIHFINNLIAKIFTKLPRLLKIGIIYVLLFNFIADLYNIYKDDITIKEVQAKVLEVTALPKQENKSVEEQKEEICNLDSTSCKIAEIGKEIGLNDNQILISIAISKWETGNYTSNAFLTKNNVGGMMCSSGLISYDSLDAGINAFLTNLKNNYFDIGLDTLEKIQPKYCPVGAKNDPKGLNKNWLNGTNSILQKLMSK